jgi:hypothetical protein
MLIKCNRFALSKGQFNVENASNWDSSTKKRKNVSVSSFTFVLKYNSVKPRLYVVRKYQTSIDFN